MAKKTVKKTAKPKAKPVAPATSLVIGKVGPRERDEMQALFERKNGLLELVQSLTGTGMLDNKAFYEKVVADLGRTTTRSRKWWDDKAKAYGWPNKPGWHWSIDFDTCQISMSQNGEK